MAAARRRRSSSRTRSRPAVPSRSPGTQGREEGAEGLDEPRCEPLEALDPRLVGERHARGEAIDDVAAAGLEGNLHLRKIVEKRGSALGLVRSRGWGRAGRQALGEVGPAAPASNSSSGRTTESTGHAPGARAVRVPISTASAGVAGACSAHRSAMSTRLLAGAAGDASITLGRGG